ncbi:hypothetical protein MINT15_22130 [Saccharomonospora viridis]|uniref:Uncharacterized protein n=1 Tax=Saccharomonospora viridis TaxID=1852 RepID=A0A837DAK6_9PSEU|nr:hypothetical protein MINT15_22130 [Saccharomonospora viridis]
MTVTFDESKCVRHAGFGVSTSPDVSGSRRGRGRIHMRVVGYA